MRPGLFAMAATLVILFAHAGGGSGAVGDTALLGQFSIAHAQQAPDQLPFVTTWKTDATNQTVAIPLVGSGMTIHWGDGSSSAGVLRTATHTYANPGTHTVSVYGDLKAISLGGHPDASKLVSIGQWGDVSWTTMRSAFHGATIMVYEATDVPDLSHVTDISQMFHEAASFNGDISSWNVSSVTDISYMFWGATSFNQPLDSWDVSSAYSMDRMFYNATSFDQNLGGGYVTIDSTSINAGDVPGVVGTISTQNSFLDSQSPVYRIEPDGDSERFTIVDGNQLSMVSAAADQTTYTVTIVAAGDSVFEDGNNRRTIQVTLVG